MSYALGRMRTLPLRRFRFRLRADDFSDSVGTGTAN